MNGSEKQITWAIEIQTNAINEMTALRDALVEAGSGAAEAATSAINALAANDSAKFFIDNRDALSVIASHPAQLGDAKSWKNFPFAKIRGHAAFSPRGLKLSAEGRVIFTAIREMEENERIGA